MGADLLHQGHEAGIVPEGIGKGVPLDVEFGIRVLAHQLRQVAHVTRTDVALVRPGVNGDAVGPRIQAQASVGDHRGVVSFPGIADQGNFVEVNT